MGHHAFQIRTKFNLGYGQTDLHEQSSRNSLKTTRHGPRQLPPRPEPRSRHHDLAGILVAFYGVYGGYWRHCQYEENKFVRIPINERTRDPNWAVICQRQKMNFNGLLSRNPFQVLGYPLQEARKVTN